MMVQDHSGQNLVLTADQRVALAVISASAHALGVVGNIVRDAAAPSILSAASAVISGTHCPFGAPPEDVIVDYDSGRNMYMRCLHSSRHCWDMAGKAIPCP